MTSAAPAPPAEPGPRAEPEWWRAWLVEGTLALLVVLLGLGELLRESAGAVPRAAVLVVLGVAAAVLLARRAPGVALALVWLVGLVQVVGGVPVLLAELGVVVVAFGCARWGHPVTVTLAGVSIPAAGVIAALLALTGSGSILRGGVLPGGLAARGSELSPLLPGGAELAITAAAALLGVLVLALPWLAGLVVRSMVRARRSEVSQEAAEVQAAQAQHEVFRAQHEAEQAQEIARLRDGQARLARDVHDVVGHSLAVILAQAESAQYLPDDPAALKATLATIATSARGSLGDVRQVLASTGAPPGASAGAAGDLASLVAGVRATGREVVVDEIGRARALPPELEVVAHRVLTEMLTNAVKHGDRTRPVHVERHWPSGGLERDLRIEVHNGLPADDVPGEASDETRPLVATPSGQGVDGMRRRLDSVGGRFDVRARAEGFTATAWVPVGGAPR